MSRVLLTGSSGFVGSHMLRHLLRHTDWTFALPVTFRHKGVPARITAAIHGRSDWQARCDVVVCDLTAPVDPVTAALFGRVDKILNVASESHVDRSITDPVPFIRNNTDLMVNVLEYALRANPDVVLHMSTDEVYGPAYGAHSHAEWETIAPSNPYSASKAAQEAIAFSYWRTYGVPVVVTNTMNLIGPMQSGEKFVPTVIRKVLAGETVQIHSAEGVSGSRHWIDVQEFAAAWLFLLQETEPQTYPSASLPSRFHIVGEERSNLWIAQTIAEILDKPLDYELTDFHSTRPGHDPRYSLDGSKLKELGWVPSTSLQDTLAGIVDWYRGAPEWLA
jgi:dTDP-glucose 4,6-dehydratase